MKNLFLIIALMLVGSLTYANTDKTINTKKTVIKELNKNSTNSEVQKVTKENNETVNNITVFDDCFTVTLSCGVSYQECPPFQDITTIITTTLILDGLICG
jgi:hypothetical protein